MLSEVIKSEIVPDMPISRIDAAVHLAAVHFGLDLKKYPTTQVESLLAMLPATVSARDEATVARLLSVCSVGETMFMRHPDQFRALTQVVSEAPIGVPGRPLSVWSAGCSSGEEAYSLAAHLAGYPGGARVLGTDVSARAIERAKTGRYRYWSLRGVDPASTTSWLNIDSVNAEVRSPIRNVVEFRIHNLKNDPYPRDVDIIFCRNVLLYFCEDAAAAVIEKFYECLRPSGVLFLGYVDPLPSPDTPFLECYAGRVLYYRKPAAGATVQVPAARSHPPPPSGETPDHSSHLDRHPAPHPPAPSTTSRLRRSVERGSRKERGSFPPLHAASQSDAELERGLGDEARERFHQRVAIARCLCAQGSREEALALLRTLSDERPLEIEPYVLMAMVADEGGLRDVALEAARRAYFLAPEAPIAPFLLGMCLDQIGERATAEARYLEARRALETIKDPLAPLAHAEGMTAYQLRRSIDARFNGC